MPRRGTGGLRAAAAAPVVVVVAEPAVAAEPWDGLAWMKVWGAGKCGLSENWPAPGMNCDWSSPLGSWAAAAAAAAAPFSCCCCSFFLSGRPPHDRRIL